MPRISVIIASVVRSWFSMMLQHKITMTNLMTHVSKARNDRIYVAPIDNKKEKDWKHNTQWLRVEIFVRCELRICLPLNECYCRPPPIKQNCDAIVTKKRIKNEPTVAIALVRPIIHSFAQAFSQSMNC